MSHLIKIYAVCRFSYFRPWYLKELMTMKFFLFYLHLNFCYVRLMISQSRFSGTRTTDISKYIFWERKIYFEISIVWNEF